MERLLQRTTVAILCLLFGISITTSATYFSLIDAVVVIFAVYIGIHSIQTNTFEWLFEGKESFVLAFFVFIVLLGLIFAPGNTTLFGAITLYLVIFFLIGRFLKYKHLRDTVLGGYLIGAVLSSFIGIIVVLFFRSTGLGDFLMFGDRLMFLFSDPNVYGAFLVPALLILIGKALYFKEGDGRWHVLNYASFFLLLSALLFTGSRAAYLQGTVALLLLLYLERARLRFLYKKAIVATVICSTFVILFFTVFGGLMLFEGRVSASDIPRINNALFAWTLVKDRDIRSLAVGSGSGSYEVLSPQKTSSHNTYLRLLIENGLIGLSAFVLFVGTIGFRLYQDSKRSVTINILAASMAGILIHSMLIDTLHWRHFWLILGLL